METQPKLTAEEIKRVAANCEGFLAAFRPIATSWWHAARQAYIMSGKPYGDTEEGLERWVDEQAARTRGVVTP